eukprot:360632_1
MPQAKKKNTKHNKNRKGNKNKKRKKARNKYRAPVSASNLHKHTKTKSKQSHKPTTTESNNVITTHEIKSAIENLESNQPINIPKHKMSKALKYQKNRLSENPHFDYVLVGKKMDYGVQLCNVMGKTFFRVCQSKAVESGDERSIGMMFQMLYENIKSDTYGDYNVQDLKKQLFMEYGKNIDWDKYMK